MIEKLYFEGNAFGFAGKGLVGKFISHGCGCSFVFALPTGSQLQNASTFQVMVDAIIAKGYSKAEFCFESIAPFEIVDNKKVVEVNMR